MAPDGGPIEEKANLRDLGVRISTDLRGRIRHLMFTVLRTRLDYYSRLWFPSDQCSINRLESVQRQFLSQIIDLSLKDKDYWEKPVFPESSLRHNPNQNS
jgi:hypothetical protein